MFARRYWHTRGAKGRTRYVAFPHSFHGRTMGALSVTSDEHYRTPFEPLVPGATFVTSDEPEAVTRLIDETTAAVIVEPIRGEGGVRPIPAETARAIAAACQRTGTLLITDEVQSGSWRTGAFLHGGSLGLQPDLVALGKAIGAGVPVGATLLNRKVAEAISAGDHGTTYGGNLLACRAALTFLDVVDASFVESMKRSSARLFQRLHACAARHARIVAEVRGAGLIAGLDLTVDATPVIQGALERGLLVNRTSGTVVRLLPAYIVTERDVDEAMDILDAALGAVT
jgi:acetylornithine/succinyldiaminopimelate/putrescine aminotransferase